MEIYENEQQTDSCESIFQTSVCSGLWMVAELSATVSFTRLPPRPHIMHDNCFSEPEDMSLWNCMVLNGIFMFLFNEESRKCSVPIVQNYNKNQFCAHKQIRNKPFMNQALHSCKGENSVFYWNEKLIQWIEKTFCTLYILVKPLSLWLSFVKSNWNEASWDCMSRANIVFQKGQSRIIHWTAFCEQFLGIQVFSSSDSRV